MIDTCQHLVKKIIIKNKRVTAEKSHTNEPYDVIDIIVQSDKGTVVHTLFGEINEYIEITSYNRRD